MHRVEIEYCVGCRWLIRAAWMAQELLSTFSDELDSVALMPAKQGGVFEIRYNDRIIWSRKEMGRFPEITELKQLLRDEIAPQKSLGHTDKTPDTYDTGS